MRIEMNHLKLNESDLQNLPLHYAATADDVKTLELLLDERFEVDSTDSHGNTALKYAAAECKLRAVSFLLERHADPTIACHSGHTPLECAAAHFFLENAIEVASLLIRSGADVNSSNEFGETPLFGAGSVEMAKLLLDHDADPLLENANGWRAHHMLFSWDFKKSARYIVRRCAAEHSKETTAGNRRIIREPESFTAIRNHSRECIECPEPEIPDPNIQDEFGNSMLWAAVEVGFTDIIRDLLRLGADPNLGNFEGISPFSLAIQEKLPIAILRSMLEAGADPNQQDLLGCTPLFHVGSLRAASLLLDHGADIHKQNIDHETALSYIANHSHDLAQKIEKLAATKH